MDKHVEEPPTSSPPSHRSSKIMGLSMDKDGTEKKNPLDIPEIVAMVAPHITEYRDLRSVREMSTHWKKETLLKWRNSAVFLINDKNVSILTKAFEENPDGSLSDEEKDPLQLAEFPFKKYRFTHTQGWTYPLAETDLEKNVIWDKCITPFATYVDVGECSLKKNRSTENNLPAIAWILDRCPNVTEFAFAPVKSEQVEGEPEENEEEARNDNWNQQLFDIEMEDFGEFVWHHRLDGLYALAPPRSQRERTYPLITSLTISTPQNKSEANGYEPLFRECSRGQHEVECGVMASSIIGEMMSNLKTLTLPSGGGASCILTSLTTHADANNTNRVLESLTAWSSDIKNYLSVTGLTAYLSLNIPPLRELKMSIVFDNCTKLTAFHRGLYFVLNTLSTLELELNCEMKSGRIPNRANFALTGCYFPTLTYFKVQLDYVTFRGILVSFNLSHLNRMPMLREFHFGTKDRVEKSWVTRKIFEEEAFQDEEISGNCLTLLKSFHYHGNFTTEALHRLGEMAENLETLEVVFDEENFTAVKDIWPALKNIKLLSCSDVPEEDISAFKNSHSSLNIVNESGNYCPAVYRFTSAGENWNNDSD